MQELWKLQSQNQPRPRQRHVTGRWSNTNLSGVYHESTYPAPSSQYPLLFLFDDYFLINPVENNKRRIRHNYVKIFQNSVITTYDL